MTAAEQVVPTLVNLIRAMPADVGWALVGGLAVSARSEPRFTRDVDLAVAVADDQAAEAVTASFAEAGWTIAAFVEQSQVGRLAQVRLRPPDLGVTGYLLFASSGIEPEITAAAETLEVIPALRVPVAQIGHLIALKLLSVDDHRLQDRMDLEALSAIATEEDWQLASGSVALITARGFHRDRDLPAALAALRAAPPPG